MLVDDGLVDTEKIGTMVCFWAFPSKALNTRKRRLQGLQNQIGEVKEKIRILEERVALASVGKDDTEERRNLQSKVGEIEAKKAEILSELEKFREFDPARLKQLQKETEEAKNAANRWTDNIDAVKQWCKNKFQIEEKELNKQFEIPEDLDYVD